jgi:hypothetical protein
MLRLPGGGNEMATLSEGVKLLRISLDVLDEVLVEIDSRDRGVRVVKLPR